MADTSVIMPLFQIILVLVFEPVLQAGEQLECDRRFFRQHRQHAPTSDDGDRSLMAMLTVMMTTMLAMVVMSTVTMTAFCETQRGHSFQVLVGEAAVSIKGLSVTQTGLCAR